MNISPIQNTSQTSFGSINLIQVSKKAFKNPDDIVEVNRAFNMVTRKITGEIDSKCLRIIFKLFGLSAKIKKTISYLEQPGYVGLMKNLKKTGNYSINWLSENTGIPIADPLSQDHHSFYVLTKEQKNATSNLFSIKNLFNLIKKALNEDISPSKIEERTTLDTATARSAAWINQQLLKEINPVIKDEPVHKFIIDDLSQLPKVFEQIDY